MRQNITFDLDIVAFSNQADLPVAVYMVIDDPHRRASANTGAMIEADFVVTERPGCALGAMNSAGLGRGGIFLNDKPGNDHIPGSAVECAPQQT